MDASLRTPVPAVPADALIFSFPGGLRSFMLFAMTLYAALIVAAVAAFLSGPTDLALGIMLLGIPVFASLVVLAQRRAARYRDKVAVSAQGIWYLPRKGEPTFIPWSGVARVEAHDTAQRLVLVDARDDTKIGLEYQLSDIGKLRDFVLDHVPPSARRPAAVPNVFHRTWINKGVLLGILGFWLFLTHLVWSQGQPAYALIIVVLFGAPTLVLIARDPTFVVIAQNGIVIKYPGWKRTIPFSIIRGVSLKDLRGNGDVWAAVIIERDRGRPLKLLRSREGSNTLHDALRSAWLSAGGRGAPSPG